MLNRFRSLIRSIVGCTALASAGKARFGCTTEIDVQQFISCPKCAANLPYQRNHAPHFDSCGFEHYLFKCARCDARLAGIIDPSDQALLLTVLESVFITVASGG